MYFFGRKTAKENLIWSETHFLDLNDWLSSKNDVKISQIREKEKSLSVAKEYV